MSSSSLLGGASVDTGVFLSGVIVCQGISTAAFGSAGAGSTGAAGGGVGAPAKGISVGGAGGRGAGGTVDVSSTGSNIV